jgi:hypothetical protein
MKIFLACEESQAVTIEARKLGHEAYSCDIIECSGGHPEWHIKGDALKIINPEWYDGRWGITPSISFLTMDGDYHQFDGKWDMIIAFPPCTHLAVSGALRFEAKRADGRQREGLEFFCKFLEADCERVAIENPVNIISGKYCGKWFPDIAEKYGLPIKPTQAVHPWMFGHPESKKTCFWLKGLPELKPTDVLPLPECGHWKNQTKEGQNKLVVDGKWIGWNDPRTKIYRSKTYQGIAKAMAEQWAGESK